MNSFTSEDSLERDWPECYCLGNGEVRDSAGWDDNLWMHIRRTIPIELYRVIYRGEKGIRRQASDC